VPPFLPQREQGLPQDYWQKIAEDQAVEILRLRAQLASLSAVPR